MPLDLKETLGNMSSSLLFHRDQPTVRLGDLPEPCSVNLVIGLGCNSFAQLLALSSLSDPDAFTGTSAASFLPPDPRQKWEKTASLSATQTQAKNRGHLPTEPASSGCDSKLAQEAHPAQLPQMMVLGTLQLPGNGLHPAQAMPWGIGATGTKRHCVWEREGAWGGMHWQFLPLPWARLTHLSHGKGKNLHRSWRTNTYDRSWLIELLDFLQRLKSFT